MRLRSVGVMLGSGTTGPGDVAAHARHAESVGLDAVFAGDHLLGMPLLDASLTLATAAAVTERVKVGFAVMVPALRGAAWAAKQVASLQLLSGGRVILGVGAGGPDRETEPWEALGLPHAERGRLTDAALDVLPSLIAGRPARLESGVTIALAPGAAVPPIWVGGGGRPALRRAVDLEGAWFPSMVSPGFVVEGARRLEELAARRGRPVPEIAVGGAVLLGDEPSGAVDAFVAALVNGYGLSPEMAATVPITGSPAQAAERFAAFAEAGAAHLVLAAIGGDWRRQVELIAEARSTL